MCISFVSQDTFFGRFRHFLDVIDPSTLFVTEVNKPLDLLHGSHASYRGCLFTKLATVSQYLHTNDIKLHQMTCDGDL